MKNILGFITLNSYALILMMFIMVVFYSKKRLHKTEDNTYSYLIIFTILMSFTGIVLGLFVIPEFNVNKFILSLTNKFYLTFIEIWTLLLTFYTFFVSRIKNGNSENASRRFTIAGIIISVIILLLPIETSISDGIASAEGPSVMFTYLIIGVEYLTMFVLLILDYRNLKNKKYIPIYLLAVFGSLIFVIQVLTNLNYLINPSLVLIITFMYHTIENPDVKMLSEVYKNKELMEQTYEDKANFLFEMTQEVREPLHALSDICDNMKDEKNIDIIKNNLSVINNLVRQLDFVVNNVLNISTLDVQKIKFVENRYNLKNLFDDILIRIKVNGDVEFRTRIPNNLPYLYGDHIKLKQVLYSILMNSVDKTKIGFVEFNVDLIEKYDIVRIICTIKDSGIGISVDKVNEILSTTGEFETQDIENLEKTEFNIKLCQKIIKAMGGNLLIKSKVGKGTEVILTVDQRKFISEENKIYNYESISSNSKRILVVCQDKNITEILKKRFNANNVNTSFILYGMDAVDKIKSGKKYDYILIDDEMKEMSGYTTLKELEKIKGFNIPVIIMLHKNKENIKEHYLNDGFTDYILLDNLDKELDKIINKY